MRFFNWRLLMRNGLGGPRYFRNCWIGAGFQNRIAHHLHTETRSSRPNFIAINEDGFLDSLTIQIGAICTLQVTDTAALATEAHREVQSRQEIVLRNHILSAPSCSADG